MSDDRPAPTAVFRMRPYWLALGAVALFMLWPFVVVAIASLLAQAGNCSLLETGPTPCAMLGADWGGVLHGMASAAGFAYFSVPVGVTLVFMWLLALIVSRASASRRTTGIRPSEAPAINFGYYGLALAGIAAVTYAVLEGWLPGPLLFLVLFAAIFWLFSFLFALYTTIRRLRTKP